MKKILITAYNLDIGGIETALINLLKKLDLNKYQITLVLEKKEGIFAALHVYYEFDYDAENDQFIYTFVIPYDDW